MDRTNTYALLSPEGMTQPYIQVLVGREKGRVFELGREHMSIGRALEADIQFTSDAVSRIHANLRRDGRQWIISDNGSKNGIQVNGLKTPEQRLQSGDLVQVGDFVFRFVDPIPASKVATPRRPAKKVNLGSIGKDPMLRRRPSPLVWVLGAVALGGVILSLIPLGPSTPPEKAPKAPVQAERPVSRPTEEEISAAAELVRTAASVRSVEAPPVSELGFTPVQPITKEHLQVQTSRGKKSDPRKSLKIYLEEGRHYLSTGDFDSATIAFNFAILIDPRSEEAIRGMEAAQERVRDINAIATPVRKTAAAAPEMSATEASTAEANRALVKTLMEEATRALLKKQYPSAVEKAEAVRKIEIKGETRYLNEAKQIIDQGRMGMKDEFDPFLAQAQSLLADGSFLAARELCDQMLKKDSGFTAAKECRDRAEKGLSKQASRGGAP